MHKLHAVCRHTLHRTGVPGWGHKHHEVILSTNIDNSFAVFRSKSSHSTNSTPSKPVLSTSPNRVTRCVPTTSAQNKAEAIAAPTTVTVIPLPANTINSLFDSPPSDRHSVGTPCSRRHSNPISGRPRWASHGNIPSVKHGHTSFFVWPVSQSTFCCIIHTQIRCEASCPLTACRR